MGKLVNCSKCGGGGFTRGREGAGRRACGSCAGLGSVKEGQGVIDFGGLARARSGDPATSKAAADGIRGMTVAEINRKLVQALIQHGTMIVKVVAERAEVPLQSVTSRFVELRDLNLVRRTGVVYDGGHEYEALVSEVPSLADVREGLRIRNKRKNDQRKAKNGFAGAAE